jgi:thimet oligopeptidase
MISARTYTIVILCLLGCSAGHANTGRKAADLAPVGKSEEDVSPARQLAIECLSAVTDATVILEELEDYQGPTAVDGVLRPYNLLLVKVFDGVQHASVMQRVHPDRALRQAASDCERRYLDLRIRTRLSRPLYELINRVDVSSADPKTQRFVELTLRDFRLAGVHQDEAIRARIRQLENDISALQQTFRKNITEDVRFITVTSREALAGLPDDWIEQLSLRPDGTFRVTTDYPHYRPFMRYAERDDLRRALFIEFNNRGYPENRTILEELLRKRNELARLQGFSSWADRAAADKMIRDEERARAFVDSALEISRPRAEADHEDLLRQLKISDPGAARVSAWQTDYLTQKLLDSRYRVSGDELRRYFDYSRVRDGIFELTSDLFGIEIRSRQDADVWHASVEAYEFVQDGEVLGRFYLDMHPREGKYKHASHVFYRAGLEGGPVPESVLVCNFPGGTGASTKMEHGEVESFLHEFGHLIHYHLRYHQPWLGISQPERDFMEAPSQMLEEWIYDTDTLRRFAVDDAGRPIPASLVERTRRARSLGEGLRIHWQLTLADLSLTLHGRASEDFDLDTLYDEVMTRNAIIPHLPEVRKYASFGHLGNPAYAASYYTYVWSQAIADDMATRFLKAGMRDRQTALIYRRIVLETGGARPAEEYVAEFLGRPFNLEALRRRIGTGTDEAH